jgi:hypothetical protein
MRLGSLSRVARLRRCMPFKHNAVRRHRIPKQRFRVTNWPAYEAGLKRRGDLTFWLDEAALAGWQAPRRTTPGGQPRYSDLAIELVLILRFVFHLALRQAEAFSRSVLRLLGLELAVPDHTTLSRRGRAFAGRQPRVARHEGPVHFVLDSTGLQLFGQGEWDAEKHGRARRQWRKLHLAVDADTGEIAAHVLTEGHADDAAQAPGLLGQIEGCIATATADGAYDSDAVYQVATRQHGLPPDVVIPPRASAVPSTDDPAARTQRDRHIRLIAERGRMAWQRATGYGRRNLVETAIGRYKHLIGPKLRARILPGQQGEATLAVAVLNRMIRTAKPVSVRRT